MPANGVHPTSQKPAMLAVETQIAHVERKIKNADKIVEDVKRDLSKEQQLLSKLQADLRDVSKASDAAASM